MPGFRTLKGWWMVKIRVSTSELQTVLEEVKRAVGGRSTWTLPALRAFMIDFDKSTGRLSVKGTDLEVFVQAHVTECIESDTSKEATPQLVDAGTLYTFVKAVDGPLIEFEWDTQKKLTVISGRRSIVIQTLALDDFPNVNDPFSDSEIAALVDARTFSLAVRRVELAASHDEARPILTSVHIEFEQDRLILVTTDSYRMAVLDIKANGTVPGKPINVPGYSLLSLARALTKTDGMVEIRRPKTQARDVITAILQGGTANEAVFVTPHSVWQIRQIEGEYPNWRQLIPTYSSGHFKIDVGAVLNTARLADKLLSNGTPVLMELTSDGAKFSLANRDAFELIEDFDHTLFTPQELVDDVRIAFNPRFLLDAARVMGSEENASFYVRDSLKPALFEKSVNGIRYHYLLMPVRI